MAGSPLERVYLSRRSFMAAAMVGGLGLAACGRPTISTPPGTMPAMPPDGPPAEAIGDAIRVTEAARPHSGRVVTAALTPQTTAVDLGGVTANTLSYDGAVPAKPIRASVGDELAVTVANQLDHPTSVHWHGIALRNDMDGAAPATPNIDPGREFTYRFSVPDPGTYWAHPHTGLDTDYGLYVPVIVDDPAESGDYDAEWIVVLDDWTDGIDKSPPQIYRGLRDRRMPGMHHMGRAGPRSSSLLGGDAGDVEYPYYLINGRIPEAPSIFTAKPGERIRIRIINAGADTAFRVALTGHTMTVTHTDGNPVAPTEVDALLLGMSERYDVLVTAGDGVFPLVAAAEGKKDVARALLSTGAGTAPRPEFRPAELGRRVGTVEMFTAAPQADLGSAPADVNLRADLSGGMMNYTWAINGRPYPDSRPLAISKGQRATLTFTNRTMMWHPMHLHGHSFQVLTSDGRRGPRKDTVNVLPMRRVTVVVAADNPGVWMLHCHNTYHQAAGMMTSLNYTI